MPADFPLADYQAIHSLVANTQKPYFTHYAGAWNAIAHRFRASSDYDEEFRLFLQKDGEMPPANERHAQEVSLFNFFGNAYSIFESGFYAAHALSSAVDPVEFGLSASDLRNVNPTNVAKALSRVMPHDPVGATLSQILADADFAELKATRNILIHRIASGRNAYVGGAKHGTTDWSLNGLPFGPSVTSQPRAQLSRLTGQLLGAINSFVLANQAAFR